jgi:hypothetical protein
MHTWGYALEASKSPEPEISQPSYAGHHVIGQGINKLVMNIKRKKKKNGAKSRKLLRNQTNNAPTAERKRLKRNQSRWNPKVSAESSPSEGA